MAETYTELRIKKEDGKYRWIAKSVETQKTVDTGLSDTIEQAIQDAQSVTILKEKPKKKSKKIKQKKIK